MYLNDYQDLEADPILYCKAYYDDPCFKFIIYLDVFYDSTWFIISLYDWPHILPCIHM